MPMAPLMRIQNGMEAPTKCPPDGTADRPFLAFRFTVSPLASTTTPQEVDRLYLAFSLILNDPTGVG